MRWPGFLRPFRARGTISARRLNDLREGIQALEAQLRAQRSYENQRWQLVRGGIVEGPFMGQVVDEVGEEADYTDERYWITSAYCSNAAGTHDADMTFGLQIAPALVHVTATNLAEVGASPVTHVISTGTKIMIWRVLDAQKPPIPHYVFHATSVTGLRAQHQGEPPWTGVWLSGGITLTSPDDSIDIHDNDHGAPAGTLDFLICVQNKGDMRVGVSNDVTAVVPVGTGIEVLMPATGETTGVEWTPPRAPFVGAGGFAGWAAVKKTGEFRIWDP